LLRKVEGLVFRIDPNRVPLPELSLQDFQGQGVHHFPLDRPFQRPGTVGRIEAQVRQQFFGRFADFQLQTALLEPSPKIVVSFSILNAIKPSYSKPRQARGLL
jgi:hypothetical protein